MRIRQRGDRRVLGAADVLEETKRLDDEVALDPERRLAAFVDDRAGLGVEHLGEKIVGRVTAALVVVHDLDRGLRIVRIDHGERSPGDVGGLVDPAVGAELRLPRVLLGRGLERGRIVGRLERDDLHRHAATDEPLDAGRDEILHAIGVLRGDDVAGLHLGGGGDGSGDRGEEDG